MPSLADADIALSLRCNFSCALSAVQPGATQGGNFYSRCRNNDDVDAILGVFSRSSTSIVSRQRMSSSVPRSFRQACALVTKHHLGIEISVWYRLRTPCTTDMAVALPILNKEFVLPGLCCSIVQYGQYGHCQCLASCFGYK